MPISAEQWRVNTGMVNASRGFRPHSIKPPQPLCDLPIPPPPSDWKGYSLALTLLCLPLLYKIYALGATVMMYLVRGENYGLVAQDSYGMTDAHLHHGHWSGVLLLLLSSTSYFTMTLAAFLMSVHEYRKRNKYQLVLTHPLHHLKFLCWFNMEGGEGGGLQMVPKIVNGCVYATFMMDPQSTLQCVRTSVQTVNRKATGISVTFVSFVLQLSTIALAMLLLLGGDVERNPGPSLGEDDIKTLVNELKPATPKYFDLGLQLGVKPARIEIIEQDHPFTERRLTEILLFWLRGNTDVEVCWESIVNALIKVDRKELARELMEKNCPNKKETLFDSQAMCTGSDHAKEGATHTTQQHGGKVSIPVLDTSLLDDTQKQRCQKLSADIDKLTLKFQDLIDSISASLEKSRTPISTIVARIRAFQAFEPVYATGDSRSILEHRMTDLTNAKSVDDVINIIGAYSSFFNYHLVERVIKSLGTDKDRKQLSDYEKEYRLFAAECMVYECPTRFQGPTDEQTQRKFMVKVDDSFENCTLSHLERFINKLSGVLKLSEGTLSLESIRRGCLELTLQTPLFVYQNIFPLSSDQEKALAALGVIKISAGDYQYPHSQDEGDNDDNGKPDDGSGPSGGHGDSGIDTLTAILSELSEQSDEVASIDSWDPYDVDYHFENKTRKPIRQNKGITALHIASYQGNLDYVKILVNSEMFKPSQRDEKGYTALHYAVLGGQLDVVKYFIEEQQCNPSDFCAFGETSLHIACRCGDLETVKYLVVDQQVDPMCEDEEYGITPLHAACIGGNIEIVRLLVNEMGAYVSIKEITEERIKQGYTSIHLAAAVGHLTVVKYFISELKCDPNIRGQHEMTPLHLVAGMGHVDVVKYLINKCDPSLTSDTKRTPLFFAIGSNNLEIVRFLGMQKKGSDPMSRDIHENTLLHMSAALLGKVEIVKYLISELKCDPNAKNIHGATLLHVAAQKGHVQMMEYLIDEKGCSPLVKDNIDATPLFNAAEEGHLNVVKFLSTKKHCNPLLKTSQDVTPLHISAANGHLDIVKFLITELKCDPNLPGQEGSTPLHVAALKGHMEVMKFLLNEGNCVCSPKTDSGLTPLHYAAREGHLNAVKLLTVDHHCDPNSRDSEQCTPLYYAVRSQIEFFINDLNCDPNIDGFQGLILLHVAAEGGSLDTVKVLLKDRKCSPTRLSVEDGTTPLHVAACCGHLNIVKFLISDYSCDPSARDEQGTTPLHVAAACGHVHVMKYLVIDKQCDPSQLDNTKSTPLHYAAKVGHLEAVKFLTVDENCDPYCRDQNASTPLHLAAARGHVDVVKFLISELECNPLVTNSNGQTPCQLATISGHNEIITYLKNAEMQMYTPKAISTTLKEGDDPLQSIHYFPPYNKLPEEREFNEYYKTRDGVNWLFMAEITNSDNSQKSGFLHRNETLVCDRSGRDNIPILFYHDPILERNFTFSTLKKGHTLIVQQATQHHFRNGTIGLRIELLSTLLVIPCSMKDLFTLSELYYKCKDTHCWSCGKTQTGDTSSCPEESVSKTTAAAETLKKCSACKVARYCSKECQAADWKTRHRRLCKVIPHFMKLTQL